MSFYNAIHLALKAHKGQVRKLDGDIYAAHPIEVGFILSEYNLDKNTIIAGILHDTIEDTYLTYEIIEEKFNTEVAQLVRACSENNKELPWKERKLETVNFLKYKANLDVKYISCADKLSNIKSLYRYSKKLSTENHHQIWEKFNAGFEEKKWYYKEVISALKELKDLKMYQELKKYYALVFD